MGGGTDNLNDDEATLGPAALTALRELHTPAIAVPRHRDASVLADAQVPLGTVKSRLHAAVRSVGERVTDGD